MLLEITQYIKWVNEKNLYEHFEFVVWHIFAFATSLVFLLLGNLAYPVTYCIWQISWWVLLTSCVVIKYL